MKKTYEAYCARCDAHVRVTMDPDAAQLFADAELECLDRCPSCDDAVCPLEEATPEQLSERLEFVPHQEREVVEDAVAYSKAEAVLREGRIQAMRRGRDPVR